MAAMVAHRFGEVSTPKETAPNDLGTEEIESTPSASDIKESLANVFAMRSALNPVAVEKPLIRVGDVIDLDSVSGELRKMLHSHVSVELSTNSGLPDEVVLLGSDLNLVASPQSSCSRQRVIWHHLRENIESITLDTAQNVADLIVSDGAHKSLKFRSAEWCLRFAACFYQAADVVSSEQSTHGTPTDARTIQKGASTGSSTEQLNS
jgi:hypothetical protein